jgi:hypothetical protein
VKFAKPRGDAVYDRFSDCVVRDHPVEHPIFGQPFHPNAVIDDPSRSSRKSNLPVEVDHPAEADVGIRAQPAVESYFILAGLQSLVQRRVIEEAKIYGLFQLDDVAAAKQQDGDMRLLHFDRQFVFGPFRRVAQLLDHFQPRRQVSLFIWID